MEGKRTGGRRKIEIKRIENEDNRFITFSKRRSGMYKKASELAAMCGAEVGVVVFSPTGKPYSYGNPSVEYVVNRFLNNDQQPADQNDDDDDDGRISHQFLEAYRQARTCAASENHNELVRQLEAVEQRGKALQQLAGQRGKGQQEVWWEAPLKDLDFQGLTQLHDSYEVLVNHVCSHLRLTRGSNNRFDSGPANPSTTPHFDAVAGSNPNMFH